MKLKMVLHHKGTSENQESYKESFVWIPVEEVLEKQVKLVIVSNDPRVTLSDLGVTDSLGDEIWMDLSVKGKQEKLKGVKS